MTLRRACALPGARRFFLYVQLGLTLALLATAPPALAEPAAELRLKRAAFDPLAERPALPDRLRLAGAQAREALVQAAADRWRVRSTQCEAKSGRIIHTPTGRSLAFGDIAEDASKLALNPHPKLKSPSERRLIGRNLKRLDTPAKVDGSPSSASTCACPTCCLAPSG